MIENLGYKKALEQLRDMLGPRSELFSRDLLDIVDKALCGQYPYSKDCHCGDCSIYQSPICDCGFLRRAVFYGTEDKEILNAWAQHTSAIHRNFPLSDKELVARAHKALDAAAKKSPEELFEMLKKNPVTNRILNEASLHEFEDKKFVGKEEILHNTDMTGTSCTKCKTGEYRETSMEDDWYGVLHCVQCGDTIDRYKKS